MPFSPSRSSSEKGPAQRKTALAAPKLLPDVILPPAPYKAGKHSEPLIAIGSSTGGTDALRRVLSPLPANTPGIVVVQHMPPIFTARFAQRLDSLCDMRVKEAADGDRVRRGEVLIATGGYHLVVRADGTGYFVNIVAGPPVTRHCPSVDVLFRSVAQAAGSHATAVILTGMGDDGALGMSEIKQAGGYTIAQSEETCVVYGMPKEAVRRGAIDDILPLNAIAATLTKRFASPNPMTRPRGAS